MKGKHFPDMFGGLSNCLELKDDEYYHYTVNKNQEENVNEEIKLSGNLKIS